MTHGPEHHMEHAEHAKHAAHDPFDRRVAMTIAIVAAVLACVTMLSHRAHNATLLHQAEANRLQTEANIMHTKASDQWNYYQSKNLLNRQYLSYQKIMAGVAKDPAKASERAEAESFWNDEVEKYRLRLPGEEQKARDMVAKADEIQNEAKQAMEHSREAHHQANRFDWGELAVELAVVLCSVAVLTKQRGFWFVGIAVGVV